MAPAQLLLVDMVQAMMKSEAALGDLSVSEIIHFITVASALKNKIEHHRQLTDQDHTKPPLFLSDTINIVLARIPETSADRINLSDRSFRLNMFVQTKPALDMAYA
ncbi:hypothetical protein FS837_005126 [Tulasnella sp. UAMH 9824]|nr:hypothetical protein FS837_005126 [Tulasnella sp. UAMH 9824]